MASAPSACCNVAGNRRHRGTRGDRGVTGRRWNAVLAVNLSGPFYLSRAVIPAMVERGRGAIVNVSSARGRSKSAMGGIGVLVEQAGLLGLRRHLGVRLRPRGIR